jgi:hypothetical protein
VKTVEELAEKYGNNTQQMLNHMMKAVQMYGENISPNEYFAAIEAWVVSLMSYMLRVVMAGTDEDTQERAVQEFMDYAMFDKMARLYTITEQKKGKKLIVP